MNDTKTIKEFNIAPVKGEAEILISQAIAQQIPVEALEKLLAMRRELKAEKAKEEFDRAMKSFQAKCPTIEKKVQGYNYKYADLTTIVEQVKELLSKNGFSYTFDTDETENKITVYCKVKHIGGHTETSKAIITRETTTKMNASQQSGAAMTYGKRYAFVNAFAILTGDEDTDAADKPLTAREMAEKKEIDNTPKHFEKPTVAVSMPPQDIQKITSDQKIKLLKLLGENGKTPKYLTKYLEMLKIELYKDLTVKQADNLLIALEKKFKNPSVDLG